MATSPQREITALLNRWGSGDEQARDRLISVIYDELRGLARAQLQGEHARRSIDTTGLVHEAYLRLAGGGANWENRAHFFGAAARQMRQILVDLARRRSAQKRGADLKRITLDEALAYEHERSAELLAVNEALQRLSEVTERGVQVVEMKFFAGMTTREIGHVLRLSTATIEREWSLARAWLLRELGSRPT